jgi:hypothetical protein
MRQINSAIGHYEKGELECAITLSAAAEGQLPDTEFPYLLKLFTCRTSFQEFDFNITVNWLKHVKDPDEITIAALEADVVLIRAVSKFIAVYQQSSRKMNAFLGVKRTYWARKPEDDPNPS